MAETRRNPYIGPRSFQPGEPLFGRDREALELRYLLTAERIVLLYSPSGAGKSSLVNAGLIHKLKDDFEIWGPTRVNTPPPPNVANRYVWSALSGLAKTPLDPGITWREYLAGRQWQSNPLIIFDQFEEILRVDPVDTAAKREFFEQVGEVLCDPAIWALFVLREDYLAPLDPYVRLIPTHFQNRYRLDRLTRAGAADAIEKPARNRSEGFAPGVVATLVENLAKVNVAQLDGAVRQEVGDYVEPVHLQVVCFDLWERMLDEGRTEITSGNVERVEDALARYYDHCVRAIAGDNRSVERQIRNWFNEKLITPDKVRNQVRQEPDGSSGGLPRKLVQDLVDTYLVRPEPRPSGAWFELAHDRLVDPVRASNREWLERNLEKFQKAAAQWAGQDRTEDLLLVGDPLAEATKWAAAHPELLTAVDKAFLTQSEARQRALDSEAQKNRQQRLLWIGLIAALVVIALTLFIVHHEAQDEAYAEKLEAAERGQKEAAENLAALKGKQAADAETEKSKAEVEKGQAEQAKMKAVQAGQLAESEAQKAKDEKDHVEQLETAERNRALDLTNVVNRLLQGTPLNTLTDRLAALATYGGNLTSVNLADSSSYYENGKNTSGINTWFSRKGKSHQDYTETGRDFSSVYLRDVQSGASTQINLLLKQVFLVSASGSGQKIGDIKGADSRVNGWMATTVTYNNAGQVGGASLGAYQMNRPKSWLETRSKVQYVETGRDDWSVYLSGPSGPIQLDLHQRKVKAQSSNPPKVIADITDVKTL